MQEGHRNSTEILEQAEQQQNFAFVFFSCGRWPLGQRADSAFSSLSFSSWQFRNSSVCDSWLTAQCPWWRQWDSLLLACDLTGQIYCCWFENMTGEMMEGGVLAFALKLHLKVWPAGLQPWTVLRDSAWNAITSEINSPTWGSHKSLWTQQNGTKYTRSPAWTQPGVTALCGDTNLKLNHTVLRNTSFMLDVSSKHLMKSTWCKKSAKDGQSLTRRIT